jgi:hypothetical protein
MVALCRGGKTTKKLNTEELSVVSFLTQPIPLSPTSFSYSPIQSTCDMCANTSPTLRVTRRVRASHRTTLASRSALDRWNAAAMASVSATGVSNREEVLEKQREPVRKADVVPTEHSKDGLGHRVSRPNVRYLDIWSM